MNPPISTPPGRALVAALFLCCLCGTPLIHPVQGQPDQDTQHALPKTTAGTWLATFLKAYNTGDLETIRRFVDTQPGAPTRLFSLPYLSSLYREFGPLSFYAQQAGTYWAQGTVTKGWAGLDLASTSDSTFRISGVTRGLRPEGAPLPAPLPPDELAAYLDGYLSTSAQGGHFSGAVLLAKDGKPLFEGSYGMADRSRGGPNRIDTPFQLASVTKAFIGVAIAQLAQQGKLSFDDPIGTFIPEYPAHIGDKVTIHHLLTHTSGIELDDHPAYNDAVAEARSLDDLLHAQLRFIEHLNRGNYDDFEPLGRFDYTNEGIDLLGVIIERASGQAWRSYLKEHIFSPAGMSKTGLLDADTDVPELAKGYSLRDETLDGFVTGPRREVRSALSRAARPAGSGYSTVGDMLRFANALQRHQLLDPEHVTLMMSPHIDTITIGEMQRRYGYTFEIMEQGGLRTVGHSGGAPGMNTVLAIYPDQGYVVVVLSNFDRGAALKVAGHIQELIAAE